MQSIELDPSQRRQKSFRCILAFFAPSSDAVFGRSPQLLSSTPQELCQAQAPADQPAVRGRGRSCRGKATSRVDPPCAQFPCTLLAAYIDPVRLLLSSVGVLKMTKLLKGWKRSTNNLGTAPCYALGTHSIRGVPLIAGMQSSHNILSF